MVSYKFPSWEGQGWVKVSCKFGLVTVGFGRLVIGVTAQG